MRRVSCAIQAPPLSERNSSLWPASTASTVPKRFSTASISTSRTGSPGRPLPSHARKARVSRSQQSLVQGAIPINGTVQLDNPDLAGLALDAAMPAMVPGIGSDIKAPGVVELAYAEVPDHVVKPRNGPRIVRLLGASRVELLWLDNSCHVATLDNDKDLIAQRTAAFISSIAGA